MLRYNLAASIRSIKKNLSFTLINISGLALGIALVIILLGCLQFEFSFDKFNANADRIFRVVVEFKTETMSDKFAHTPAPLGEAMKNDISEVTDYVRFGSMGRTIVSHDNDQFWEEVELADPSIFKIFSFRLISGNPETALNSPGSIVISEAKARKYFGTMNPVGQVLLLGYKRTPFTVTGVMKDLPANSQLQFDFLGSFSEIKNNLSWNSWNYTTYILGQNKNSYGAITTKLAGVVDKNSDKAKYKLLLQPLTRIHLYSRLRSDLPSNTDISTIYIIGTIFILVLLVACINYMNMATARYTRRGKEAGIRKVAGATNTNLSAQFLTESLTITFIAFIIGLFLCFLVFPAFSGLTGIPLERGSLFHFSSLLKFIILIITISLISGSYPAFMLSSVKPVASLRDDFKLGKAISVKGLRKGLVIFQFFVSISLITSTLVIWSQMAYIRNKDLGLTPDQVVVVPIYKADINKKYELYKKEILGYQQILNVSAVSYFPGVNGWNQNAWWEGLQDGDNTNMMRWLPADNDIVKTLKLELIKGENFPENASGEELNDYILNESAAKLTGWKDPIGKQFEITGIGRKGRVIGIVKDFNYKSLNYKIEPLAIVNYSELFDNLMIKISAGNIPATIDFLKLKWKSIFPQSPFEYSFLNDDFQKLYEKVTTTLKLITWVSLISLFISCIGLFGLVLFTIDQRIREIGIRKVAGSTAGEIVLILNTGFIKWILVSFVIACPVIIILMHLWLQGFAYRIHLTWWMFGIAGLSTVLSSLLTVSLHTFYIASKNPVECLRHE